MHLELQYLAVEAGVGLREEAEEGAHAAREAQITIEEQQRRLKTWIGSWRSLWRKVIVTALLPLLPQVRM